MTTQGQGLSLTFVQGQVQHFQTPFPKKSLGRLKPKFI